MVRVRRPVDDEQPMAADLSRAKIDRAQGEELMVVLPVWVVGRPNPWWRQRGVPGSLRGAEKK